MEASAKAEDTRRQKVVERLKELKVVRGLMVQMAKQGQILEVRCEMPDCYCPKGRRHFNEKTHPPAQWQLTADHYPILKSKEGKLTADNVRLAHTVCNRVSYGWRKRIGPMLQKGMALEDIAAELNKKRVQPPQGSARWSAAMVRKALVS